MFKYIIHSPYLNLISGVILLLSAGYEILSSIELATLGAHHGILFFALIQIIKTIPEVLRGSEEFTRGKEMLD